jgi:hypothetical protein
MRSITMPSIIINNMVYIYLLATLHLKCVDILYLSICIIGQWVALLGLYHNHTQMIHVSHILWGVMMILGSILIQSKVLLYWIIFIVVFVFGCKIKYERCLLDIAEEPLHLPFLTKYIYLILSILLSFRFNRLS